MKVVVYFLLIFSVLAVSCNKNKQEGRGANSGLDKEESVGMVSVPDSAHASLLKHFSIYTNFISPNGNPVHLLVQEGVAEEKVNQVITIFNFFLQEELETYIGADKSQVFNSLAENKVAFMIFNTENSKERALKDVEKLDLNIQSILSEAIVVDGSAEYFGNIVLDLTLNVVSEAVYEKGIAIVYPDYAEKVNKLAQSAVDKGFWFSSSIPELGKGNRIGVTYFGMLNSIYWGFWGNYTTGLAFDKSYVFSSREALREGDAAGYELINNQFLPNKITKEMTVYPEFEGMFYMVRDTVASYSSKTQYLQNIKLRGSSLVDVLQNSYNNKIEGNSADNSVFYTGNYNEYIVNKGYVAKVEDLILNRDGLDSLINIEFIVFQDTIIPN